MYVTNNFDEKNACKEGKKIYHLSALITKLRKKKLRKMRHKKKKVKRLGNEMEGLSRCGRKTTRNG